MSSIKISWQLYTHLGKMPLQHDPAIPSLSVSASPSPTKKKPLLISSEFTFYPVIYGFFFLISIYLVYYSYFENCNFISILQLCIHAGVRYLGWRKEDSGMLCFSIYFLVLDLNVSPHI